MRLSGLFIVCCLQSLFVFAQPAKQGDSLVKLFDAEGKERGFATYRNGHCTGPYSYDDGLLSRGNTVYKPSSVNWVPLKKVKLILLSGDTTTAFLDAKDYKELSEGGTKMISVTDILLPASKGFPYIHLDIDEPGVIPTGRWVVSNAKSGHIVFEIDYDDNGNMSKIVAYQESGKIAFKQTYPPCDKRKVMKYSSDGSFYDEVCEK